jgi:hypothetical protein
MRTSVGLPSQEVRQGGNVEMENMGNMRCSVFCLAAHREFSEDVAERVFRHKGWASVQIT